MGLDLWLEYRISCILIIVIFLPAYSGGGVPLVNNSNNAVTAVMDFDLEMITNFHPEHMTAVKGNQQTWVLILALYPQLSFNNIYLNTMMVVKRAEYLCLIKLH